MPRSVIHRGEWSSDLESIKMVSVCSFLSIGREEGLTESIGVPALQVSFFRAMEYGIDKITLNLFRFLLQLNDFVSLFLLAFLLLTLML